MAASAVPPNYDLIKYRSVHYINLAKGVDIMTGEPIEVTPATKADVAGLYDIFRQGASCKATSEEDLAVRLQRLESMWPVMERDLLANRGFYEFVKDNGLDSDFMLQFYFDIPNRVRPGDVIPNGLKSNSSHLMDTAYGYYICGNGTYREIPACDQAMRQVLFEPTWGGVRYRGANYCLERLNLGDGAKVLSLGAGTLPEMRFFGWQDTGIKQELIAYDENGAGLSEVLPVVFEKPLSEYNISYHFDQAKAAFENPDLEGACNLIIIQGMLSYNLDSMEEIFCGAKKNSSSGGITCGDLQLGEIGLMNCSETLGWKETNRVMSPSKDVAEATEQIERYAKAAGLKVDEISVDATDGFNFVPTTVWFKLQA